MNISAVNCTPIKPPSFGVYDGNTPNIQEIFDKAKTGSDTFAKEGEEKTKLGTAVSVALVFLGLFAAAKNSSKFVLSKFPSLTGKIVNGSKSVAGNVAEVAGKVKANPLFGKVANSKVATTVKTGLGTVAEQPITKAVADKVKKVATNYAQKDPASIISDVAGVASSAILGYQVATVDGNGDNIADIAQKDVNAYKNALGAVEIFSEILSSLA